MFKDHLKKKIKKKELMIKVTLIVYTVVDVVISAVIGSMSILYDLNKCFISNLNGFLCALSFGGFSMLSFFLIYCIYLFICLLLIIHEYIIFVKKRNIEIKEKRKNYVKLEIKQKK